MMAKEAFVARKYARAYLHVFGDELSVEHFKALEELGAFLSSHKQVLFFLQLRHIDATTKQTILNNVFNRLGIHASFMHMVQLLLKDKRAFLLEQVVEQTADLYKELKCIIPITITTPQHLDQASCTIIEHFMAQKTGCRVLANQAIDPTLIAGLRIQADTLLWEYSVRKQLRQIRN